MSSTPRKNKVFTEIGPIERISTDTLKPPKKMVRSFSRQTRRLAAKQVEQFGLVIPLLIDQNNVVIGGFLNLVAAQMLELPDVPVVRVSHLSNEQLRAYSIAEQRLSELPTWDERALAEELKFLSSLDLNFDLELTGFSCTEIDRYISNLEIIDTAEVEEDIPHPGKTAVSKSGDIWKLHKHRLICGSSLQPEIWAKLMGNELAALVFTDPPYNVKIDGHVSGNGAVAHREFEMAAGEMTTAEYRDFLRTFSTNAHRYSAEGSLHYLCIDWRHVDDVLVVGREIYTKLVNICCWVKSNGGMGSFYRSRHELIPVFRKGRKAHQNNIELGRHGRNRTNVWEYAGATTFAGRTTEEGNTLAIHPTVKPIKMIADAIMDSTARNEIIADPFLGSGATLLAAERVGRQLYGIEIDPLYVDVAIRRWQNQTGRDATHAPTGKTFNEIEAEGARGNV